VRAAAAAIQAVPYRVALALGWGVAAVIFYGFRYRVREAQRRIRSVFGPELDSRRARDVAWRAWRNFCFGVVDMIRIPVSRPAWVKAVVEIEDPAALEALTAHCRSGRGALVATCHMGSWEMAALAAMAYGIPLFSLAARQKNPLVDAFINRMRQGTGFETLLRHGSVLKGIVRRIRAGKVMAILPDVRSPQPGLPIRFLGGEANIAGGLALIARLAGEPVFPCVMVRRGWTRHLYRVQAPVWPDPAADRDADARRLMQAVFDVIDRAIRAEPDQWFWFNKRWILDPLPAPEPAAGGPPASAR